MANPTWLGTLTKRDENLRAAHGLYPAKDGWYKTIAGKKRYIASPKKTLAEAIQLLPHRVADITGNVEERPAQVAAGSTTIEELVEIYLAHLWQRHKTGSPRKLARRTYGDYEDVLGRFTDAVGPTRPAAAVETGWFSRFMRTIAARAETTKRREIIYVTAFFNWAGPGRHSFNFYKAPVQFGPDFRKPDEGKLRAALAEDSTLYTGEQVRAALATVAPSRLLYAAGLLAMNCALLPVDVITIPFSAVDLAGGTHNFPRGKTSIPRLGHLMPETVAAIERYVREERPPRASDAEPIFVGPGGVPYASGGRDDEEEPAGGRGSFRNAVARHWGNVTELPMKGLRTTFGTVADGFADQQAVDMVMGHVQNSVRSKHYVKHFEHDRIKAVTEQVWQRVAAPVPPPSEEPIGPDALARKVGRRAVALATARSRLAE